ncbi:MAG: hypothetical protein ACRCZ6_03390, partial [Kluyvera sp.]|uniref:hypothetical protein n=1 Tax=Kluyvera sp. TaxID=1538228 RepID=UPI003F2D3B90
IETTQRFGQSNGATVNHASGARRVQDERQCCSQANYRSLLRERCVIQQGNRSGDGVTHHQKNEELIMSSIARNLAWLFLRLYEPRIFESQGVRTEALVLPSAPSEIEKSGFHCQQAGSIQKPVHLYFGRDRY